MTTGRLKYLTEYAADGHDLYRCLDCRTVYPVISGKIRCNGHVIRLCPWCRPDSRPWTSGRGE
jgi:hypothetical protein